MKNFILPLAFCLITSSGIISAQSSLENLDLGPKVNQSQQSVKLPAAYYKTTTSPVRETAWGVENSEISIDLQNINIPFTGAFGPAARPDGTEGFGENLIYTSGPFINDAPNLSIVEDISEGMGIWGYGSQKNSNNSIAEEIVLPMDFDITSIDVYAYQTGTQPPSITGVYVQVWDGDPSGGGASVVWGDLSTNILEDVEDTGVYRVMESDQGNTNRKIQKVTANTNGLSLATGSYWVEYTFEGSGSSGPWAPQVAVLGETVTGNALQNLNGTWGAVVDGPNDDPQGFPLQMYGVFDNGGNSCAEINPSYDWLFEVGLDITSGSNFRSANDLTLEADESFTLQNITAILLSDWPITEVDVTYYDDNNGLPGTEIGSQNSVILDNVNAIGSAHTSNHNVYEVNMTVDSFEFIGQENSSTTYWIQLSAINSNNTDVYWTVTSGNSVGYPLALFDSNWGVYDTTLDGLYIWSGDCSPVLGVEGNELAQLSVYPNPADEVINLESSKNIESVKLFNLLGQEILSKEINNNYAELNLSNLPVGTYILKTTVEGQVETQQIIKR